MVHEVLARQQAPLREYSDDFHVVHFSIQSNHIHMIVEARGKPTALCAGISGFVIAFAKRLNKLLHRKKGKVWADRYHARELCSPREVRNSLGYLFQNWKKHGYLVHGPVVDPFSSAHRFDGWEDPPATLPSHPRPHDRLWPPIHAFTWLLSVGWRRGRHGLLPTARIGPSRSDPGRGPGATATEAAAS